MKASNACAATFSSIVDSKGHVLDSKGHVLDSKGHVFDSCPDRVQNFRVFLGDSW